MVQGRSDRHECYDLEQLETTLGLFAACGLLLYGIW